MENGDKTTADQPLPPLALAASPTHPTTTQSPADDMRRRIGIAIGACRRLARLSQEELADRVHWHRSRVAKTEIGERGVDIPDLITLAHGLNLSPFQLLERILGWESSSVARTQPNLQSPSSETLPTLDLREVTALRQIARAAVIFVNAVDPEEPYPLSRTDEWVDLLEAVLRGRRAAGFSRRGRALPRGPGSL
jgi:transcriptional regulator with XRE-family HTH domain